MKFIRIMKLNMLFMLFLTLSSYADSRAQTVTLSVRKASLESVFAQISQQTDYKFIYDDELISRVPAISLEVKNSSLDAALTKALENTNFQFEIISKTVVISRKPTRVRTLASAPKAIQQKQLNGRIQDEEAAF